MEDNRAVLLRVRDLVVKFRLRGRVLSAIRGVSLDVRQGETLAIVGESGSGKTVLTKSFMGMLDSNGWIDSGRVEFEGRAISGLRGEKAWRELRGRHIASVFQDPMTSLNPLRSVGYQIAEVLRRGPGLDSGQARREAISLLGRVGIPDPERRYRDYPFQFSGGMRQRVVIAIALALKPKLLICDEPTTALDVTVQAQILDLIDELKAEYGFAVIYITHDLGVVARVADRVAVFYAGQILEEAPVRQLFHDPRHPYTWALLSAIPILAKSGSELFAIPGAPPTLFNQIRGEAFAPRNPYALAIDFEQEAPFRQVGPGHWVKSWLADERAPRVGPPAQLEGLRARVAEFARLTGAGGGGLE